MNEHDGTPAQDISDVDAAAPDADPADAAPAEGPDVAASSHLDIEAVAEADPRSKAELLDELLTAEAKRDEYLDDLRRSHADFENYRKRALRDGATQRAAGKAEVAGALLDVLDDLDRTMDAASTSADETLAKGVELVASKLVQVLTAQGLERIDETAVPFDPTRHDAVQQQPGDEPRDEPVVAAVLRPGYRLGERVLRAAMVVVEQ